MRFHIILLVLGLLYPMCFDPIPDKAYFLIPSSKSSKNLPGCWDTKWVQIATYE